jgi:hypothetical protein
MGSDADPLREAVTELYSADPAEFVERRGALAARARAAGEASAAKSIAALRKPTRSAWVVNQLIRSDPGVIAELGGLGDELRAAQGSMDGAAIRELSVRRRQLIAELSRRAFAVSGLPSPPAALRDEVNATLGAALADPQVAEQLAAGTLERPAHADGFGPAGPPVLTVVPPPGARRTQARPQAAPRAAGARRLTAQERAEAAAQARAEAAAREQAERAERRRAALADAEQAVAEADQAAAAAATAELDLESSVQRLEEELADARQDLTNARLAARRARNRQRQARQARDRLAAADAPRPRT